MMPRFSIFKGSQFSFLASRFHISLKSIGRKYLRTVCNLAIHPVNWWNLSEESVVLQLPWSNGEASPKSLECEELASQAQRYVSEEVLRYFSQGALASRLSRSRRMKGNKLSLKNVVSPDEF